MATEKDEDTPQVSENTTHSIPHPRCSIKHWFGMGLVVGALLASLPWWMPLISPDFSQRLGMANPLQISHLSQEIKALKARTMTPSLPENAENRLNTLEKTVAQIKQSTHDDVSAEEIHHLLIQIKKHQAYDLLREYLDKGAPYAVFLNTLMPLVKEDSIRADLQALDAFKELGVPTREKLAQDLAKIDITALAFPQEKTYDLSHLPEYFQQAWEYLKSLVRIRKAASSQDKPTLQNALILAQEHMATLDVARAIASLDSFQDTHPGIKAWLEHAKARLSVDAARGRLDTALYSTFSEKQHDE